MADAADLEVEVVESFLVATHALIVTGPLESHGAFFDRRVAKFTVEPEGLDVGRVYIERPAHGSFRRSGSWSAFGLRIGGLGRWSLGGRRLRRQEQAGCRDSQGKRQS